VKNRALVVCACLAAKQIARILFHASFRVRRSMDLAVMRAGCRYERADDHYSTATVSPLARARATCHRRVSWHVTLVYGQRGGTAATGALES
jgi:hypothetical protein